jgi:hypothetical protein
LINKVTDRNKNKKNRLKYFFFFLVIRSFDNIKKEQEDQHVKFGRNLPSAVIRTGKSFIIHGEQGTRY